MSKRPRWDPHWVLMRVGPEGICERCKGTGSEWRRRKDGEFDRRCTVPLGPCTDCQGSGGWVRVDGNRAVL